MPGVQLRVRNAVDQQVGVAGFVAGVLGGQTPPGQVLVLAVILSGFEGGGAARKVPRTTGSPLSLSTCTSMWYWRLRCCSKSWAQVFALGFVELRPLCARLLRPGGG